MIRKAYLLLSLSLLPLFSDTQVGSKEDPIVVKIPTNQSPKVLYIKEIRGDGSLEKPHLNKLLDILIQDAEDSLQFSVTHHKADYDRIMERILEDQLRSFRSLTCDLAVALKLERQQLKSILIDPKNGTIVEGSSIFLSGDFDKDKEAIHCLFDNLHLQIFGRPGIASSKILYARKLNTQEDLWVSEIIEISQDGSYEKRISETEKYLITPILIPKTREKSDYDFIYVSYQLGQPKIFKASTKNPKGELLITLRGNQLLPAFSRLGDKIAFISDASGRADLFIQGFTPEKGMLGKPLQIYTCKGSIQASPTFSPDSSSIAFVSDKDGSPKVYLINLLEALRSQKTPSIKLLSKEYRESTSPSWSPDGKKIAFSAKIEGTRQIVVYDVERDYEYVVTRGREDKENPSFAPDSLHIVYNTTSPTYDIYKVDLIKKQPVKLTNGGAIHHYPSWEQK